MLSRNLTPMDVMKRTEEGGYNDYFRTDIVHFEKGLRAMLLLYRANNKTTFTRISFNASQLPNRVISKL